MFVVLNDAIHLLTVSEDGQYIIAADHQSRIVVWTLSNLKVRVVLDFATVALDAVNSILIILIDLFCGFS